MTPSLKVAVLCPGVGLVQRGFERLFRDLFDELSGEVDMTLFKGGGRNTANEKRVRFLARGGRTLRILPLHRLMGRTPMHAECLTFALSVFPRLVMGKYDVVHVIDPPLARVLYHLRRLTGAQFKLLYTEGTAMPPQDYPPADHIHQISAATFEDAVRHGHPPERMTIIPCGVRTGKFAVTQSRAQLRDRYGVPQDRFLVLSVAALNRNHKRTDYLIEEFAAAPGAAMLWIDGSLDHGDPDLAELASQKLGDRVRVTHVDTDCVGELYAIADLFVHTAGFEAFGLAIVEAAICGLPILTHDDPHFRWLIPNRHCQIDMTGPGNLARALGDMQHDADALEARRATAYAQRTYSWEALRRSYLDLYRTVVERA